MIDPKQFLHQLHKNLNILEERRAKWGGNAPLDLLNQIEDHHQAIGLTEQRLAEDLSQAAWREALRPLLVNIRERTSEATGVTISDVERDIINATIAGRDVTIYNYHYHGQVEPTASAVGDDDEPIPANPYRGLFAFRPEHAPLFFGRETFTKDLVEATERQSLTAVLGASGSGKSSVVFAGLCRRSKPGAAGCSPISAPATTPFSAWPAP